MTATDLFERVEPKNRKLENTSEAKLGIKLAKIGGVKPTKKREENYEGWSDWDKGQTIRIKIRLQKGSARESKQKKVERSGSFYDIRLLAVESKAERRKKLKKKGESGGLQNAPKKG